MPKMARGLAKALFLKKGKLEKKENFPQNKKEKKENFEVEDGKVAMFEFVCYPRRIQLIGSYCWEVRGNL